MQSPVQFIENRQEDLHKYLLGLNELTGVTTILREVIFRDKYACIGEDILSNAAARGTAIHEAIQALLMGETYFMPKDLEPYIVDANEAVEAWREDEQRAKRHALACEYLVSDCKDIATRIDIVEPDGEGVALEDIKTTYTLDEEFLSWQLSIEKYLFEKQNPSIPVTRLTADWYNRAKRRWVIKDIPDKGRDEVERLIAAWKAGEFWGLPMPTGGDVPAVIIDLGDIYAQLTTEAERATARRDEFRDRLMQAMKDNGIKTFKTEGFQVTYIEPGTSTSFDREALLKAHPELADDIKKYFKTSPKKDSIKITIKEPKH